MLSNLVKRPWLFHLSEYSTHISTEQERQGPGADSSAATLRRGARMARKLRSAINPQPTFAQAKHAFDATIGVSQTLPRSLVPVNGEFKTDIPLVGAGNRPLEEYYKWQFLYALIYGGLYPKDYLGAEVFFPKGTSTLRIDAAIFDDSEWLTHYNEYWDSRRTEDLQWLNDHLLAVVEFKRDDKEIEHVFTRQVKPAMREKDPSDAYVLGIYYDHGRLFIFHRRGGKYLRYDESKNQKGDASAVGDFSLNLPDPYSYLPSLDELRNLVHRPTAVDHSNRGIDDLEVITTITTVQVQTALSNVLRELSRVSRINQRGYQILIESFALKIFDEKRNQRDQRRKLRFYVTAEEARFSHLNEQPVQGFIRRMQAIWSDAEGQYQKILSGRQTEWHNQSDVRAFVAVCVAFQDFSFVRSSKSDLYQLVFYNFADSFKRDESAQFLTPLPVIDFMVQIVNPRDSDTVFDPCCGIGDFLSLSFVNSQEKSPPLQLDDANIYGVDLDEYMVRLATLNMLLNGDGRAKLYHKDDKGSILYKLAEGDPPRLVELIPAHHSRGNWDEWPDGTRLMKFDVVLTNPPFGEDRAYRPASEADRRLIECYETWGLAGGGDNIDLGVVFLENAYRCLKDEGRMGIVLSNSIAAIGRWRAVREWLIGRMRIVALFDLPANIFAETGANTTLVVAYKPKARSLAQLNATGYEVFIKDIHAVGYEKRTSKRNVYFNPVYRVNINTFEIETDTEGRPVLDEDFTRTIAEFKMWGCGQEEALQRLFLREG